MQHQGGKNFGFKFQMPFHISQRYHLTGSTKYMPIFIFTTAQQFLKRKHIFLITTYLPFYYTNTFGTIFDRLKKKQRRPLHFQNLALSLFYHHNHQKIIVIVLRLRYTISRKHICYGYFLEI